MTLSKQIEGIEKEIEYLEYQQYEQGSSLANAYEYKESLLLKIQDAEKQIVYNQEKYIAIANQIQDKVRQMKDIVINYKNEQV